MLKRQHPDQRAKTVQVNITSSTQRENSSIGGGLQLDPEQ